MGGGALNRGLGGLGSLGGLGLGLGGRCDPTPPPALRLGGGAGGGPLLLVPELEPVFCGLRPGAAAGGGGGAARDFLSSAAAVAAFVALYCSKYVLINPAFSSIWSSVIPIVFNSCKTVCTAGSLRSIPAIVPAPPLVPGRLWAGEEYWFWISTPRGGMILCAGPC